MFDDDCKRSSNIPENALKIDIYALFGIPDSEKENPNLSNIKRSYRLLSLRYHPDRNSDPRAGEIFAEISVAMEILSDPNLKKQYDARSEYGCRRVKDFTSKPSHNTSKPSSENVAPDNTFENVKEWEASELEMRKFNDFLGNISSITKMGYSHTKTTGSILGETESKTFYIHLRLNAYIPFEALRKFKDVLISIYKINHKDACQIIYRDNKYVVLLKDELAELFFNDLKFAFSNEDFFSAYTFREQPPSVVFSHANLFQPITSEPNEPQYPTSKSHKSLTDGVKRLITTALQRNKFLIFKTQINNLSPEGLSMIAQEVQKGSCEQQQKNYHDFIRQLATDRDFLNRNPQLEEYILSYAPEPKYVP